MAKGTFCVNMHINGFSFDSSVIKFDNNEVLMSFFMNEKYRALIIKNNILNIIVLCFEH